MKCKKCGKLLPEGAQFCSECGAKYEIPHIPQQNTLPSFQQSQKNKLLTPTNLF